MLRKFSCDTALLHESKMEDVSIREHMGSSPYEETEDDLLVHCRWASFWHLSLSLMGVRWAQPSSIKDVPVAWRRRTKKIWVSGVWNMIPSAILSCTWKEKCSRIFEDQALSQALVFETLV